MTTLFIWDVHSCKQDVKNYSVVLRPDEQGAWIRTLSQEDWSNTHLHHFCSRPPARCHKSEKMKHEIKHTSRPISSQCFDNITQWCLMKIAKKIIECSVNALACSHNQERAMLARAWKRRKKKQQLRKTGGHEIITDEPRYSKVGSHTKIRSLYSIFVLSLYLFHANIG